MELRNASLRALTAALVLAALACGGDGVSEPSNGVAVVELTPAQQQLTVGGGFTITATVRDGRGNALTNAPIQWSSTDEAVATVSQSGVVHAVAEGMASVRAASGGKTGSVAITVVRVPVASVDLDITQATLNEGVEVQVVATPRDANGDPLTGRGIQWTSSDPAVASVGALGLVTAIRAGSTTITAKVEGKTASAPITVTASWAFDLVYSMNTVDAHHELFTLDVNQPGATAARFFPAQTWASQAEPSPDGSRIAYVCPAQLGGEAAICVASRDGSASEQVASTIGEDFASPSWSPDGTKIAYVRRWNDGTSERAEVWVIDDEGNRTSLTAGMPGNQIMAVWSRSRAGGDRIAFVQDANRNGNDMRVWTMRPDGSDRKQITTAAGTQDIQPAWSPDGETIAFQRTSASIFGDIWLVDADGGNERALLWAPLAGWQATPRWSPDGKLISFVSPHETYGSGTSVYQVYTVWADGTKLARRTFDAGSKARPVWLPRL